jgi:hypothetical protein
MAFNVVGKGGVPGTTNTQPNPCADVTCHKCQKVSHFAAKCAKTTHANGTVVLANSGLVAAP